MTTIEQLEYELDQKVYALNKSLNAQYLLRETLRNNIKTLVVVEKQLKGIETYLTYSNNTINLLKQENRRLKSSCDEWFKRAINLEFKVLSAGDTAKNRK
jgi:siderophore synthetase component